MPAASGLKTKIHELKPTCPVRCDHKPETWRLRNLTLGVYIILAICIAAGFLMFLFIFERERERERAHKWGRGREREGGIAAFKHKMGLLTVGPKKLGPWG